MRFRWERSWLRAQLLRRCDRNFRTHRVLISTTTSTGQKLAARRFGAENVIYFPLDFPSPCGPPSMFCGRNSWSSPKLNSGRIFSGWRNAAGLASRSSTAVFPIAHFPATSASASGFRDCWRRRSKTSIFSWPRQKKTGVGSLKLAHRNQNQGGWEPEIRCGATAIAGDCCES